jgi:sn-1 stearoyl-lipid 9-desaturase
MSVAGEASEGAFKVNSLGNLEHADAGSGRLKWDAPRSIWNMSFDAGALILGPMFFSWSGVVVFLALSGFTLCVGHSVGFHRRLIHRSFECPKWLERVMIYVGVLVGMGGPLWTVGLHDIRDWAQRQANCHWFLRHGKSVLADGFYYLNFKLLFDQPPQFNAGPGISDDPFYRFLQRTWMLHQIPIALVLFWLGGWSWVVWGVVVRVAVCFTMHWYIAHVAHRRGLRTGSSRTRPCRVTISAGWPFRPWVKAGTATITHSRPSPGMVYIPAKPIPGSGSFNFWNGSGSRGTSTFLTIFRRGPPLRP